MTTNFLKDQAVELARDTLYSIVYHHVYQNILKQGGEIFYVNKKVQGIQY